MKLPLPTPQQERWMTAAARVGIATDTPWLTERIGGWKTVSILTRCAFFALGLVAAALTTAICWLLNLPLPMLIAGIISICVAETLIAKRKFFGAGIEEALEITGVILIIAQVMDSTRAHNESAISMWLAISIALVGIRLLNALFTTLAAIALSFTAYSVNSGSYEYQFASITAAIFCFIVAAIALAAGAKQFVRPSVDRMLDGLVIVMPVAGYCWLLRYRPEGFTLPLWRDNSLAVLPLAMISVFGIAALIIGLRRGRHAPVLAAMLCLGGVAYELRNITGLALELRLILWGSVALLVALGLIAYLRKPRNGITSAEIEAGPGALNLLEMVGVSALTPAATDRTEYQGAGGSFGGGGASGKY